MNNHLSQVKKMVFQQYWRYYSADLEGTVLSQSSLVKAGWLLYYVFIICWFIIYYYMFIMVD